MAKNGLVTLLKRKQVESLLWKWWSRKKPLLSTFSNSRFLDGKLINQCALVRSPVFCGHPHYSLLVQSTRLLIKVIYINNLFFACKYCTHSGVRAWLLAQRLKRHIPSLVAQKCNVVWSKCVGKKEGAWQPKRIVFSIGQSSYACHLKHSAVHKLIDELTGWRNPFLLLKLKDLVSFSSFFLPDDDDHPFLDLFGIISYLLMIVLCSLITNYTYLCYLYVTIYA